MFIRIHKKSHEKQINKTLAIPIYMETPYY